MEDKLKLPQFSTVKQYLKETANLVNNYLSENIVLPENSNLKSLKNFYESVRYSVLAGGKRIRPALCLVIANKYNANTKAALHTACAIELIHTYSLIHDDLPAMDNDDFRRGKPTNHKVYGEANAILAGDALLTMAFEWFSDLLKFNISPEICIKIIKIISQAAGINGMVGGQALDLTLLNNSNANIKYTELVHGLKTGKLITASIQIGAILGNVKENDFKILTDYADNIGLLFQITDDLLDVYGDTKTLGKNTGTDSKLDKATYISLLGEEKTRNLALNTLNNAKNCLKDLTIELPELCKLADYIYNRKN